MGKDEKVATLFNLISVQALLPDDGGLVLRVKATKPKDFIIKQQVRVRLTGDDMWRVLQEVVGKQLIAGFKLAAHPMSLSGEMFKSRDIRPNETHVFTDIIIGASGNYKVSQHLLRKRMTAIVQKGDPDFAFEFEYGEYRMMKWRQEGVLFVINSKLSHLLRSTETKSPVFDKETPLLPPTKPIKEPSPVAKRRRKEEKGTSKDRTRNPEGSRGAPEVHSGDEALTSSQEIYPTDSKSEVETSNRGSVNKSEGKPTRIERSHSKRTETSRKKVSDETSLQQEETVKRGSVTESVRQTTRSSRSSIKEGTTTSTKTEVEVSDERIERLSEKPTWDFQQWSTQTESKLRLRLDQVKAKLTDRLTKEFGKMSQPTPRTGEQEKQDLRASQNAAKQHNFYKAQESTFMRRNKVESYESQQYEPLRDEYNLMMEMGNYPIFSYFSQPPSVTLDMLSRNAI